MPKPTASLIGICILAAAYLGASPSTQPAMQQPRVILSPWDIRPEAPKVPASTKGLSEAQRQAIEQQVNNYKEACIAFEGRKRDMPTWVKVEFTYDGQSHIRMVKSADVTAAVKKLKDAMVQPAPDAAATFKVNKTELLKSYFQEFWIVGLTDPNYKEHVGVFYAHTEAEAIQKGIKAFIPNPPTPLPDFVHPTAGTYAGNWLIDWVDDVDGPAHQG